MSKLEIQPDTFFETMCYDSDYTIYFCNQEGRVSSFNIYRLKSQLNPNNLTESQEENLNKKVLRDNCQLVLRRNSFENPSEHIIGMKVLEDESEYKMLLLITDQSLYTKQLVSEKGGTRNEKSVDPFTKPKKILSISEYLKISFEIKSYMIQDVKMVDSEIFLKVTDLAFEDPRKKHQKWYIIKFSFGDKSQKYSKNLNTLKDISGQSRFPTPNDQSPPKIFEKWFLPFFHDENGNFWVCPKTPDQVYFNINKKIFRSQLILDTKDGRRDSVECEQVYKYKFGIRYLEFSIEGDIAICSDKSDRVIVLNIEKKMAKNNDLPSH